MTLRKAELTDFANYKAMYKDSSIQWLYLSNKSDEKDMNEEIKAIIEGWEYYYTNQYYEKYSEDDFRKDLKSKTIFIIKQGFHTIGYVSILRNGKNEYRIEEWAMTMISNMQILEDIMVAIFSKIPKEKKITVFPSNKTAKSFFEKMKFCKDRGGIYSKRT